MLAVLCWPDGVIQVRETVSPGRNFDSAVCSVAGAPTAWPLTLVMTDPAVTPAFAAGLAALAIVFVWKFLPETKELPVEEIVRVFEKQQRGSVLNKVA